ncbi:helix-turn-helix transcriptional regulator [Herbaspirillum sp. WKF16]|uniref:AraC family transcriptional regulator n=1 Tax=Herbaspirillum sp. WKF16 TaxID=3028312 RepID=UPI0023A94C95|nr:helix-turn-helix transcriptional regulator [Herbaspirillum sp. WKF16]WDZ97832.1 helix-turn-helix transcriptional regulator [Herbaspirillum sp. WKF16]
MTDRIPLPIDRIDAVPRAVVAAGAAYADGTLLPWHSHRRAQLLYGASGLMQVATGDGAWVVPQQHAVWIPAGKVHRSRMLLGVTTRSAYIEPHASPRAGDACQVLEVSPLLRQLLIESAQMNQHYPEDGRDGTLMRLLLHEIGRARELPMHIPLPRDAALAELCRGFMLAPGIQSRPGDWARRLHMSERTFGRRFREQTGMGFQEWRQRACVVLAVSRLAAGEAVTRIALDFGYERPAAFSTMFRKLAGYPPSAHAGSRSGKGLGTPASA